MEQIQSIKTNIDEQKLYCEIFNNFEREFREITQYVPVIDQNNNTSSNKIHELHIRICMEIENLLKILCHKFVKNENEFREIFKNLKKNKAKIDFIKQIEDTLIKNKSDSLESMIANFLYPDFPVYLEEFDKVFNLKAKKVEFISSIEVLESQIFYQPFFTNEDKEVPFWWTKYNKIKHDKINNFVNCNLEDLINSFAGFYILLHYLIYFIKDNEYNSIFNVLHFNCITDITINGNINSTFFKITHAIDKNIYRNPDILDPLDFDKNYKLQLKNIHPVLPTDYIRSQGKIITSECVYLLFTFYRFYGDGGMKKHYAFKFLDPIISN